MTFAIVVLVIACLALALVAGFGVGALMMADQVDHAAQLAAKRRTTAKLNQVYTAERWASLEIDGSPRSRMNVTAAGSAPREPLPRPQFTSGDMPLLHHTETGRKPPSRPSWGSN